MIQLLLGDCFEVSKNIPDSSVDLIATDLPYGSTQNEWDSILPLPALWRFFERVLTYTGTVVLTATMPFAALLVHSALNSNMVFRYDLVWEKTISSGQLNVKTRPLRSHEYILVFSKQPSGLAYNEQLTEGAPYQINRKITENANYGVQKPNIKINEGFRHARSVIKISNPRIKGGHPTQKPIELMKYIIKTYSNPNDTVLDCCMGSGTTGVAAIELGRQFIGIEKDPEYFKIAQSRMKSTEPQPEEPSWLHPVLEIGLAAYPVL